MTLMTRFTYTHPSQYVHVHVADILEEGSEEGGLYKLPEHLRCAAHTMNLVTTVDVRNVLENDSLHRSAIDQKANVEEAESQHQRRGYHCQTNGEETGQTRWNSKYDPLCCLTKLMEGEHTRHIIILNG